jgi:hypothetical protein
MSELAGIENHPLAQHYPCRVPVWWARHGSVEKDSELNGVSGRLVTLRIAKNFKRYERWLAKMLRAPKELRKPLDRMNSVLWELCDGSRTFDEICNEMNHLFKEEIAPVIARTAVALAQFQQHNILLILEEPLSGRWSVGPGTIPEHQELTDLDEGHPYDVELLVGEHA